MAIHRVTARWSGFLGSPGYSVFHFFAGGGLISDAQQSAERVSDGLANLASLLPDGVRISVLREVEEIDEDTGEITGFQAIDAVSGVEGSASGGYSAASGAVVNWRTNDLRFGRRIRGRTFLVPLAGNAYQADGTLTELALTNLGRFAGDITATDLDSEFVVWSRPRNGSGGVAASVTGYTIPDMAAVLRSRRD